MTSTDMSDLYLKFWFLLVLNFPLLVRQCRTLWGYVIGTDISMGGSVTPQTGAHFVQNAGHLVIYPEFKCYP